MSNPTHGDFDFRVLKSGAVVVSWRGRNVVTLSPGKAARFLERVERLEPEEAQLLMARVTGNFKRGNERTPGRG